MYIDVNIDRVLHAVLRREGWPQPAADHPADRGHLTRGGITSANWGLYRGLGRAATRMELDAISEEEALEFYFRRYVEFPGFEMVNDQGLRALCVDWGVTSGPDDPIHALQTSLRQRGLYDGAIDGRLGPKTKDALFNDRDPRQTYRDVFNSRVQFYVHIALDADARAFMAAHPACQLWNLNGWLARCLDFTP